MLNLTRRTEYALIGLAHLAAQSPGTVVNVREVADQHNMPGKLVAKVFHELKTAGMLKSHQGKKGGYSLARDPHALNLSEVLMAIEGKAALVRCVDGNGADCPQYDECIISDPLRALHERIKVLFDSMTISDFVSNKSSVGAFEP